VVDIFQKLLILCACLVQVCNEAETDDRLMSSGRLKHGLQKYAPVDDEDATASDVCKNQERSIEVNCIG